MTDALYWVWIGLMAFAAFLIWALLQANEKDDG